MIRMTVSAWLSAAAKNSKSDDPNGHRFCDKNPLRKKCQKPHAQHSFLSLLGPICFGCCPASVFDFAWFVGLLTHLFRLHVSSPLAISCLTANALLQPSLRAMTALPMTGFHRARITPYGKQCFRNTATLGSLPPGPARIARWPDSLPANPKG